MRDWYPLPWMRSQINTSESVRTVVDVLVGF